MKFPPYSLLRRGFTLLEMLCVLAIISLLAGVAIPGMTSMMQGRGFARDLFVLQGTLEEARQMAMAQNTLVWVGIAQRTTGGEPELIVAALASRSGQASDLAAGTAQPLMRPTRIKGVSLDATGYGLLPGADTARSASLEQTSELFALVLPGESEPTSFYGVEFRPNGETSFRAPAQRYIGIGLRATPANGAQTAGIQISRLNGRIEVLQP